MSESQLQYSVLDDLTIDPVEEHETLRDFAKDLQAMMDDIGKLQVDQPSYEKSDSYHVQDIRISCQELLSITHKMAEAGADATEDRGGRALMLTAHRSTFARAPIYSDMDPIV